MSKVEFKPIIMIEFDGAIYDYDKYGWGDGTDLKGEPIEGVVEGLKKLKEYYQIFVTSNRVSLPKGDEAVEKWLQENDVYYDKLVVSNPVSYYINVDPKAKRPPKRWRDDFVEELIEMKPVK